MATARVLQAILGFFVPLILLFIFLFCIEYIIEITLGIFAFVVNEAMGTSLSTSPDFPGPTNIVRDAIGFFPSIWDLGTLLFYGTIGHGTFLVYILIAIIAGVTGATAFKNLKDTFKEISDNALVRAGMRFPDIILPPTIPEGDEPSDPNEPLIFDPDVPDTGDRIT